jgi:hypothetical protein
MGSKKCGQKRSKIPENQDPRSKIQAQDLGKDPSTKIQAPEKIQDPNIKIQRRTKIQAPRPRVPLERLELGI